MSFLTFWQTTETDIINLISKIKADAVIAQSNINGALKWIAGQTPTIVSDLQTALQLAQAVGVVSAPELAAANMAVAALNAFAKAENSGQTNAQSVVTGYVAYTQAAAAVSSAKASAAASVKQ